MGLRVMRNTLGALSSRVFFGGGGFVNLVRAVDGRMSRGLALALPALVALSCLLPLLGLMLAPAPYWIASGVVGLIAICICSYLLRGKGIGRAIAVSTFGTAAGVATFAAFLWGVNALGTSQSPALNDLANRIVSVMPLVVTVLALGAITLQFRALPSDRIMLGVAWAIAFVTPFALAVPIGALSDEAGNAGMDVLALFVMPVAAFLVWAFILLGLLRWPENTTTRAEVHGGA